MRKIMRRAFSWRFQGLKQIPPDPIQHLNMMARADTSPNKINLTVGAYRDDNGNPWVLPSVDKAVKRIYNSDCNYNNDHLSLKGDLEFVNLATDLVFQFSERGPKLKKQGRVAQIQSLSGTGAIFFLLKYYNECMNPGGKMYLPVPSWPIHENILKTLKCNFETIPYYDMQKRVFCEETAIQNLKSMEPQSLIVLQVCGHNPTGFDINPSRWPEIIENFREKEIDVLIDNPYQGFISGSIEEDCRVISMFIESGLNVMIAQSFAKNFGLYSGRIGCMSIICDNPEQTQIIEGNLSHLVRGTLSTHPKFGAEIIKCILKDTEIRAQWELDMKTMVDRIVLIRQGLVKKMKERGSIHDWDYFQKQRGMFALTHLSSDEVTRLRTEKSIYMLQTGRVSVSGINSKNIDYLADSLVDLFG